MDENRKEMADRVARYQTPDSRWKLSKLVPLQVLLWLPAGCFFVVFRDVSPFLSFLVFASVVVLCVLLVLYCLSHLLRGGGAQHFFFFFSRRVFIRLFDFFSRFQLSTLAVNRICAPCLSYPVRWHGIALPTLLTALQCTILSLRRTRQSLAL